LRAGESSKSIPSGIPHGLIGSTSVDSMREPRRRRSNILGVSGADAQPLATDATTMTPIHARPLTGRSSSQRLFDEVHQAADVWGEYWIFGNLIGQPVITGNHGSFESNCKSQVYRVVHRDARGERQC